MINIKFIRGGQPQAYADSTYEYDIKTDENYESVLKKLKEIYNRPDYSNCNTRDLKEYFAGWWELNKTKDGYKAIFVRPFTD